VALREFPPMLLGGLRVTIAGALMVPAYLWERRKTGDRWTRAEVPMLLLLGLLGVALNQFLFIMGLSRTTATHSAIFVNLSPIVVLLLAAAWRIERLTRWKVAGMLLALAGVALLQSFEHARPGRSGPTLLGDLITFGGACAFAGFTVLAKTVAKRHSAITVNTFAYVGGALIMAPVTVWEAARYPLASASWRAWACAFYMAAISSVACYFIYYHALGHMRASRVAAFCYFQPPMAAALAIVALGEPITAALAISILVIFAGVWLTERES
jgi:drug/metabolite transporter (DMT)-like permease